MTAPAPRPRVVTAAFWCWVVASVMLMTLGLLLALNQANLPTELRASGALLAIAGLALAYLARRSRADHGAFRRAALGLALALVFVLALFVLVGGGGILWVFPMLLTMAGAILVMRQSAKREETS